MIPKFPEFKKLEVSDKKDIEKITLKYPPYSDFNFISLFSYDTENDILISNLNNNFVIKMRDYITNQPFYSFIGSLRVAQTSNLLLQKAREEKITPALCLIPEVNITNELKNNKAFKITEDKNNHDYILSLTEISSLDLSKYQKKRNMVTRFIKDNPDCEFRQLDINRQEVQVKIEKVFSVWEKSRHKNREETKHELTAIKRLLETSRHHNLFCFGILKHKKIIAFSIYEGLPSKHVMHHFEKADTNFKGIYEFLKFKIAQELIKEKYAYINSEQDLGMPGLKQSKQQWNPVHYLKKYIIEAKD